MRLLVRREIQEVSGGRKPLEIDDFGSIIGPSGLKGAGRMAKSEDVVKQIRKATCRAFGHLNN